MLHHASRCGAPYTSTLERMRSLVAIRLLAAFLIVVSGYVGWWSVVSAQWLWLVVAFAPLLVAIGVVLRRPWSEYLWYLIALSASVWWIVTVIRVAVTGWPYHDALSSVISLVPGVLLLMVCLFGSIAVRQHFRERENAL